MKSIRIFFVVALVVFAFVACEKSAIKPSSCSHASSQPETPAADQPINGRVRTSAVTPTVIVNTNTTPDQIVGGGDDDRDGGDKKPKTVGK